MTFPDRRLERPLEPPEAPHENVQDVVPPTERNQDPGRSTHDLVTDTSRPLTDDERKAADRDTHVGERVYAPASERVPREPVPGHRDFVEHPDRATAERQAAGQTTSTMSEPSFTRVARPSASSDEQAPANRWMSNNSSGSSPLVPLGIGWMVLCAAGGVGVWLWIRRRREHNKPINRLRRQARQTAVSARQRASELRDRMPEVEMPDEATRPAIGLGTALVSLAILLWQQSQSRSRAQEMQGRARTAARKGRRQAAQTRRQAAQRLSDMDWQQRLMQLKDLWSARRIELEKVAMTRR